MRKEFSQWCERVFAPDEKNIFITGDLGYNALESLSKKMGHRFVNAGVAEQNMVSVGAALAKEGLTAICYSIAPFVVFRPYEQIRLDVCIHNLNVKIVGNGGGYGYGIMGSTHHAIEDLAVMSVLPNMKCFVPLSNEDVESVCDAMLAYNGPAYLRLGAGVLPPSIKLGAYSPIRKIKHGSDVTVVGIGPVLLNGLIAVEQSSINADVFCVSELPVFSLTDELIASVKKTGKVLIIEEHVLRGGLAESLGLKLFQCGVTAKVEVVHAKGYPSHRYGSQGFHQRECELDVSGLMTKLKALQQC